MLDCSMHKHSGIFEILLSTTLTKVGGNLWKFSNFIRKISQFILAKLDTLAEKSTFGVFKNTINFITKKCKEDGVFSPIQIEVSTPKKIMKIPDSVASQMIGGELMILNTSTGACFSLDDTGASIWSEIYRGTSIETLGNILLKTSDVGPDQLRSDIEFLISELSSAGVLELEESDTDFIDGDD